MNVGERSVQVHTYLTFTFLHSDVIETLYPSQIHTHPLYSQKCFGWVITGFEVASVCMSVCKLWCPSMFSTTADLIYFAWSWPSGVNCWQGGARSSVKLFGWVVLQKDATINPIWTPNRQRMGIALVGVLLWKKLVRSGVCSQKAASSKMGGQAIGLLPTGAFWTLWSCTALF